MALLDGPAGKSVKLFLINNRCGRILPLWAVASLGKRLEGTRKTAVCETEEQAGKQQSSVVSASVSASRRPGAPALACSGFPQW